LYLGKYNGFSAIRDAAKQQQQAAKVSLQALPVRLWTRKPETTRNVQVVSGF